MAKDILRCLHCNKPVQGRGRRSRWSFVGYQPVHDTCPRKLRPSEKRTKARKAAAKRRRRYTQPMDAGCGMSGMQMGN